MKEPRRWVSTLTRQKKIPQTVNKGHQSFLKFVWLPSPFSALLRLSSFHLSTSSGVSWPLAHTCHKSSKGYTSSLMFVFLSCCISVWVFCIFASHFRALCSAQAILSQICDERDRARRRVNLCVVRPRLRYASVRVCRHKSVRGERLALSWRR